MSLERLPLLSRRIPGLLTESALPLLDQNLSIVYAVRELLRLSLFISFLLSSVEMEARAGQVQTRCIVDVGTWL